MSEQQSATIGWDIGGVNTKAVALLWRGGPELEVRTASRYFEVWREPDRLPLVLQDVMADLGFAPADLLLRNAPTMAITMTAELSDTFSSKREGVLAILDGVAAAFPTARTFVLRLDERLVPLEEARCSPRDCAAANWLAGAVYLARACDTCLWIDTGSTTTDIVPIVGGAVSAAGRTDSARLAYGELVYTGALRTPLGALAASVPLRGTLCRTAPEYFATTADVYLALGRLTAEDYTCPTADGRAKTIADALSRISRIVCADGDTLSPAEILALAQAFYQAQMATMTAAALQVVSRFADNSPLPVLATGIGAFLGQEVARRLGLRLLPPPAALPHRAVDILPCYAVAHVLASYLSDGFPA